MWSWAIDSSPDSARRGPGGVISGSLAAGQQASVPSRVGSTASKFASPLPTRMAGGRSQLGGTFTRPWPLTRSRSGTVTPTQDPRLTIVFVSSGAESCRGAGAAEQEGVFRFVGIVLITGSAASLTQRREVYAFKRRLPEPSALIDTDTRKLRSRRPDEG